MALPPRPDLVERLGHRAELERERTVAELQPESTEHARLVAELSRGGDKLSPLDTMSLANLEGRLAHYRRLLSGEINANQIARQKLEIARTLVEIGRRRSGISAKSAKTPASTPQKRRGGPGRPPNISRRPVTLPLIECLPATTDDDNEPPGTISNAA